MAAKDRPPAGHVPLAEIKGMTSDEIAFLQEHNVTHGKSLDTGMFEISLFTSG